MSGGIELFRMKAKQILSYGIWEILVFIIIASGAPLIQGGPAFVPGIPPDLARGLSPGTQSFIGLDYIYYQFVITILAMSIFVLKVLVFDFGTNLEQGIETSYLLLPVKRSRLLLPVYLLGVVLPYAVASASVFYALYLVHMQFTLYNAAAISLLDFLPLLFICSVTLLVTMKSRSSVAALGVAIVMFFSMGLFLGLNQTIVYKTHSFAPLVMLGLLFPAGAVYDFFSFPYALPPSGIFSSAQSFLSIFPWLVAGAVLINIALLVAVFWYWGRRFQISD